MFKNALVSVSDKTGLVAFLKPYVAKGLRVVSTGGTYQHLKENGIPVIDISEQTGFPEVMGGRVKTLHPHVHMAILSRLDHPEDDQLLKDRGLAPFDLVICNLYPFEEAVKKRSAPKELIEKIDIGGPTVLRASAKNFSRISVVCDPSDYSWIAEKSEMNEGDRKKLAAKVFAHVSSYDSLVAQELGAGWGPEFSFGGHKVMELRYGENPQQVAGWYRLMGNSEGLHSSQVLQGKALSYNNILDLDAASGLVQNLSLELQMPSAVIVKHNNACGAAIDKNSLGALEKALNADPISAFGGIVAVNFEIEASHAELLQKLFLECVVAPSFTTEALKVFEKKKNLRILSWPHVANGSQTWEAKTVNGGFLVQQRDVVRSGSAHWTFHGDKPSEAVLKDLYFGERVCASLKSNAISIVKNGQTLGLGMGQVNRVDSVRQSLERMKTHFGEQKDTVLISDAFFPFPDSIEVAAKAGVKWILQPGGSMKDAEVLKAAQDLKVNMILSVDRHFKH